MRGRVPTRGGSTSALSYKIPLNAVTGETTEVSKRVQFGGVMIKHLKWLPCLAFVIVALFWSRPGHAYPWMIQHQYTGCALCHVDPSGGYLLTAYGRAQRQALLSSLGKGKEGDEV